LSAASLLLDLRALDDVGYFDEHYFFYFEDADLCERLSSRGLPLLVAPAALVAHEGSRSSGGVGRGQHPALDYYFASAALHFVRTRPRRDQWNMMPAYAGILGRRLLRPWLRRERWKLTKLAALGIGIIHGWRGQGVAWGEVAARLPRWLAPESSR
jgi:GT2 family glycosyltransferase